MTGLDASETAHNGTYVRLIRESDEPFSIEWTAGSTGPDTTANPQNLMTSRL